MCVIQLDCALFCSLFLVTVKNSRAIYSSSYHNNFHSLSSILWLPAFEYLLILSVLFKLWVVSLKWKFWEPMAKEKSIHYSTWSVEKPCRISSLIISILLSVGSRKRIFGCELYYNSNSFKWSSYECPFQPAGLSAFLYFEATIISITVSYFQSPNNLSKKITIDWLNSFQRGTNPG